MTELVDFWPDAQACRDCLRIDADSASDAVTLAVHQPMRFKRRTIGAKDFDAVEETEQDLLTEFLTPRPADGLIIMPIVGDSGTGKSHVIRWLDLQLRYRPDKDRRLVIRVPKGRSLKGVLSDILDQVTGAQYEIFREQLVKAQERLRPNEAAGLLCEFMALTLTDWTASQATGNRPSGKQAEIDALVETYGSPSVLPALLRNNYLRRCHWERTQANPGPIRRLIAQLFEERSRSEVDDRKDRFFEEDLVFEDVVDAEELGLGDRKAISWLLDDDARSQAVKVLNAALDGAKHRLLGLDPSVNDLFREIRRELLKDNKELVLLIEDFAVLSGLQGALLQVIILDSFKGDEQVLCTMRTALAYTRGYMDTDTVLTRAKREHYIPDEASGDTLQRIELLVAAYLNASRVGFPRLRQAFEEAVEGHGVGAVTTSDWVPRMQEPAIEAEAAKLHAFGFSVSGIPLFPFNARAVQALALEGCLSLKDNKFIYNPRRVISNVLLRVLDQRRAFGDGAFPGEGLGDRRLDSELTQWVARNVQSTQQQRALLMLAYWGYGLTSILQLEGVDPLLAEVFGVSWKRVHRGPTPQEPRPPNEAGGVSTAPRTPPLQPQPAGPREAARSEWMERLKSWREGAELPQQQAREIRRRVAEAVCGNVDWNVWLQKRYKTTAFTPEKQIAQAVWLSNASNNPTLSDPIVLVSDDDFKDPFRSAELQEQLLAVVLFHDEDTQVGGTWNYTDSEEDAARYSALVDRLAPIAARWLAERPLRLTAAWDPVPMLVQGLLIGAKVLQVSGAATRDHAQLINALFESGPLLAHLSEETEWRKICANLAQLRVGAQTNTDMPSWQEILLAQVGARQGSGAAFAVDASRLKAWLEAAVDATDLVLDLPTNLGATENNILANRSLLRAKDLVAVGSAAQTEQGRIAKWLTEMREKLGLPFDRDQKAAAVERFRSLVTEGKGAHLLTDARAATVREAIKRFDKAEVIEVFDRTQKAVDSTSAADLLSALGWDFDGVRGLLSQFCDAVDELQGDIAGHLEKREETVSTQLDDALTGLDVELSEMATAIATWPLDRPETQNDVA